MKAVAEEAGVSRRLLYDHFPDLSTLFATFLRHKFERFARRRNTIFEGGAGTPPLETGVRLFLTLPPKDRRIFRALVSDVGPVTPESQAVRDEFRESILAFWIPLIVAATGLAEGRARAASWALANAIWSIADRVDDGTVDLEDAVKIAATILEGSVFTLRRWNARNELS